MAEGKKVAQKKIEAMREIVELIKKNETVMVASIKNLPSGQFQDIRKKLKGSADVRVVKKRIMWKALENSGRKDINKLEGHVLEDSAILFSKLDPFELAGILADNKNLIKAKPGQIAEEDIEVEPMPTDLVPGPVISEFGALGIKIAVEDGKIAIKEKKVIVKKGNKITDAAASIMAKLDIKPFSIGLEPMAVYEGKEGKIFTTIKIDKKKTLEDTKMAAAGALGLAQRIAYHCKETISYLIAKASIQEKSLLNLTKTEEAK